MTIAEIIQIVIGILSLVATVAVSFLIYWLQTRHEKEIQKLNEEKEQKELELEARSFLIDNESERDYLPWCVIASNLHPLEKHTRTIYTAYCRCSEKLQNEILLQAGVKCSPIKGRQWVQKCVEKLEADIERYHLGRNYLYEGAKYFHRSYSRYRSLQWNDLPRVFDPIYKDGKFRKTFNINTLSIGEYIDEYFYYYLDKHVSFESGKEPIPPMDYVWESRDLANCEENKVCMWLMESIENIAIIIRNRKADDEITQMPLDYTDAQAETYEDKYYEVLQALYNAYYLEVIESKEKR